VGKKERIWTGKIMKTLQLTMLMAGLVSSPLATEAQSSFLTNGLVAYYPFDGDAHDASGNGNNLIDNGATYGMDRFGNPTGAAYFNAGSSTPPAGNFDNRFGGQWMSFGTAKPLDNISAVTISMWLKPGKFLPPTFGNAAAGRILYEEEVISFYQQGNSPQLFAFGVGGGSFDIRNGISGILGNGPWVHCVFTGDGRGFRFFVNGALVSSLPKAFTKTANSPFTLGLGAYYNGSVDNLRIYDHALTGNEVPGYINTNPVPHRKTTQIKLRRLMITVHESLCRWFPTTSFRSRWAGAS
jgi:hypothetical protein